MTSVKKAATGWTTSMADSVARVEEERSNAAAFEALGERTLAGFVC